MDTFYNNSTKFDKEIILKENEVIFININKANDTKSQIFISKLIKTDYIQYNETNFKNNLIILYKKLYNTNIKNINHIWNIYESISESKVSHSYDNNLVPIIFINKEFYLEDTEDNIFINQNKNIIKKDFDNYIETIKNIKKDKLYISKENRLIKLQKPFEDDNENIKELNLLNYIPTIDKDAISNCITENFKNIDFNDNNEKCVDINNNPINIETFRILTNRNININNTLLTLYSGDNTKIIGYANKIPNIKDDDIRIFNMELYYNDLDELKKNDNVKIYFNISNEDIIKNNYSINGKIHVINNNKIVIKLNKNILIDNIKTNVLTYDKNKNYNDFYIYPEDIKKNIYYKKQLYEENTIIFTFPPNNKNEDNKIKYISFILPNISEFISYNYDLYNYIDIKSILEKYNYNYNDINYENIKNINNKIKLNIDKLYKNPNYKLNDKIKKVKKSSNVFDYKGELLEIDNLPKLYGTYSEVLDNIDNRILFFLKQKDQGYIHYIDIILKNLENDFNEIESYDFKGQLKVFQEEQNKLKANLEKYNIQDCDQIIITKFYYSNKEFNKDEGNKIYNNKFVLLHDEHYSILYKMINNNWEKIKILYSNDVNNIKLCNNNYYYENIDKNICMYDSIEELCNKRNKIIEREQLELITYQIEITNDLKNFEKNYNKYIKYLNNLREKLSLISTNEYPIHKLIYNKKLSKYKKYEGSIDHLDYLAIYNNFELLNESEYVPLPLTLEQTSQPIDLPYKQDEDYNLITNIIYNIGIVNLSEKYILYIYNSIDKYTNKFLNIILNKLDLKMKKDSDKLNNKSRLTNEKIKKLKKKQKILYISSILIILIQILYPEIDIKVNKYCKEYFSLEGFPLDSDKDNKDDTTKKYLYKYVLCIINKLFPSTKDKTPFKTEIIDIIKIIIKEEPIFKTYLENNRKNINPKYTKKDIFKIWEGFKPNINIDINNVPSTVVGRYLFTIFKIINNDKLYKFNTFNKPLILNVCCLIKVDKNINYYKPLKEKLINIDLSNLNIINYLNINEFFINIIKNKLYTNFDNDIIFNKNNIIKISKKELNFVNKFNNNYYNYIDNIKKIIDAKKSITIKKQIKNDENINNLFEFNHFNNRGSWDKFIEKLKGIFKNIIKVTSKYSLLLNDKDVINDLELYFINLNKFDDTILFKIKKISQQFITYKITSILSKIKNLKEVTQPNNRYLDEPEKQKILKINENNDIIKFIQEFQKYDKFNNFASEFLTNDKIFNTNLDVFSLNINQNDKDNNMEFFTNIRKNIYILNYIFLIIILYIYSTIIKTEEQIEQEQNDQENTKFDINKFDINTILEDIENRTINDTDEENNLNLDIYADIISTIFIEYRNTIKNNIFNNDELTEKIKNFRESKKLSLMSVYDKLPKDERNVQKLLDDIIGIKPVIEDDDTVESSTSNINKYKDIENIEFTENINEITNYNNLMNLPENNDDEFDY